MKKILIILTAFISLFAKNAQELYEQAQIYENAGDSANAMIYYKLAAQKALSLNEQNLTLTQTKNAEKTDENASLNTAKISPYSPIRPDKLAKKLSDEPYNIDEILGLQTYKLNYLLPASVAFKQINGRKRFETNFQISFQKPLFHDVFGLNETITAAYTQESWWQTAKSSTPFRETNYRPEIFVTFPINFGELPNLEYLKFGLLHESNGQGGENSRSWNRLYTQAQFSVGELVLMPRAWVRIKEHDDDNPGIEKYLGRADITAIYPLGRHFLSAMFRNNLQFDKTNKGAFELGWLFPLGNSGIYGYAKYFSGYGESLIDYNKHTNKIGVGFSFVK
ncbi:MAG: phospholipase A [Campylobacter sp.]|nr:phospholipase A [Campylobacter sp.]